VNSQDPLANAPLEAKVESLERYLGNDLVRFRIQEAAERLMRADGPAVYVDDDEDSFHVDQTGSCLLCFISILKITIYISLVSRS
jgi:hypothetical protein